MNNTFNRIRALISEGSVRISEHGYDELAAEELLARELVEGVETAELIEKLSENPLRATSRVVQAICASSVFHRARRA